MLVRRKRIAPASQCAPQPQPSAERAVRLSAMGKEARTKLATWVAIKDVEKLGVLEKTFDKLGSHEGVSILLRLAALDVKGTGRVTDEEEKVFNESTYELINSCLGFLSNAMVISTLVLSIAIPAALYGASIFVPGERSALPGAGFSGWANNLDAIHVLHWVDCALLSISMSFAAWTLFQANNAYSALAVYMPDAESKMRMASHYENMLGYIWFGQLLCIMFVLLALPFLAARVSPAATIFASVPFLVMVLAFRGVVQGSALEAARQQRELAARILHDSTT